MTTKTRLPFTLGVLLGTLAVSVSVASASTSTSPWLSLSSTSRPGYLHSGAEPPAVDGEIAATAVNVGDGTLDGSGTPLKIVDTLPAGLHAVFAQANKFGNANLDHPAILCTVVSARVVECSFAGFLSPYEQVEVLIGVTVEEGASSGENEVAVSGGGAPSAHIQHPVTISDLPTPFGVETYELTPEEAGGGLDRQAGSHPFQLTTVLNVNQVLEFGHKRKENVPVPVALPKDLTFNLPAGLIGNPDSYERCTIAQFMNFSKKFGLSSVNECPPGSVIGVASVLLHEEEGEPIHSELLATVPIFNLTPAAGEPARFGFAPAQIPVLFDTSVRTGGDYGVTVTLSNISHQASLLSSTVAFWGVPGDPRHDALRGYVCIAETEKVLAPGSCQRSAQEHPAPFLSMPTSCSGAPLETSMLADSWTEPHRIVSPQPDPSVPMPSMHGCGLLPFASEVRVSPDVEAGSTPSGLKVDVHVPQQEALNGEGLAPAMLKNIVVTLPEGLQLNPSAADGLQACTIEQVGLNNANDAACPDASKIANVTIKSPLLPSGQFLHGFVYLASPQNFAGPPVNPFSKHVAMYLVAKDPVSGTLIKLAGRVELGGEPGVTGLQPGQIRSTFANNPQLPFEDAEIEFFGGERAPLATPALCRLPGQEGYVTHALFEPWTNTPAHTEILPSSSEFDILSGPNGIPCANPLPFAPSLTSETTDVNAGGFTPLSTTLSRPNGNQNLQSVTLHYPPGVSGMLTGVPLCSEVDANAGTCPAASQIGETIVSVGVGGDPFTVTGGKVYITEKYAGAPFGLSIVNPAKAGPFDLQEGRPIVVRGKIEIDPITSALTVTTDASGPHAIPTMVEGFALQIQHVNVLINRPGFTFNPTSCNPMSITGAIDSAEGASSPVSVPFQVANCERLAFKPKFTVSTSGKTSRANGASLHVKLAYPKAAFGTQANIRSVKVDLPKALPSRLKTLQNACLARVFEANPAACPSASIVGHAKAITPLVPVPLTGPAYFVSHGGEAFPQLIVVLQGYGVTVDLHGETFISTKGITSSTFRTVPDVPVGTFELNLPEGPYSALAANGDLCASTLTMPTVFTAQNGAVIHQSTPIEAQGCPYALRVVRRKVTKRTLTLQVVVPQGGRLSATGKGLSGAAKSAKGRSTLTLTLKERHAGRLRTSVLLRFTPGKGRQRKVLRKSITVSFR